MKKRTLLLLLVSLFVMGQVRAQNTVAATTTQRDSVVYRATFYFEQGIGEWIEEQGDTTMCRLIRWAKSNPAIPIEVKGWVDKSGSFDVNERISLRYARTTRNHLVQQGLPSERITIVGLGVDTQAVSHNKAPRVDVLGVLRLAVVSEPQILTKPNKPTTPVFIPKPILNAQPLLLDMQPKAEVQPTTEVQPKAEVQPAEPEKPATQPKAIISQRAPIGRTSTANLRWYAGIEGGVSMGLSTLSSFTSKGDAGWNAGVLGGYRISPLLSVQVGISLGGIKLRASKCCEDYFLGADGVRYFEHVAGMDSYSYKEIYSLVSMQQYSLGLNVDMLQIVNSDWDKRWSLIVSPIIYGVNTTSTLKTDNATIIKGDSQFQFGAGAGVGVGYQITRHLGVGFRSSMAWVFGKHYDGIAPNYHNENMIWNNTVSLSWRFGKMKNTKK